ncbi:MAG: PEP-CTERM sorting domain-containing protein [Planctomycetaceae bacterium]
MLLSFTLVTATVFSVSSGPASADTILTTFGTNQFIQASSPEWLWDGPTSELSLLANNSSNYWQQASFGSKDITGSIGVSLQASFLQTFGFTSSNDSFIVRLTSSSSGLPKAEADFDFVDFLGASSTTITKPFVRVTNDFNYADVQEIYLIGSSNAQYGDVLAGIRLDSLTAVTALPEPTTYAMALSGIACGGYSMWRRRKRA